MLSPARCGQPEILAPAQEKHGLRWAECHWAHRATQYTHPHLSLYYWLVRWRGQRTGRKAGCQGQARLHHRCCQTDTRLGTQGPSAYRPHPCGPLWSRMKEPEVFEMAQLSGSQGPRREPRPHLLIYVGIDPLLALQPLSSDPAQLLLRALIALQQAAIGILAATIMRRSAQPVGGRERQSVLQRARTKGSPCCASIPLPPHTTHRPTEPRPSRAASCLGLGTPSSRSTWTRNKETLGGLEEMDAQTLPTLNSSFVP